LVQRDKEGISRWYKVILPLEVGYPRLAAGHGSPDAVAGPAAPGLGSRSIAAQPPVLAGFFDLHVVAHTHQAESFAERKRKES
jgi:hypothetical protein